MSWDAYRDNLLATQQVSQAAIIGLADGGVWTASPGLNVSICGILCEPGSQVAGLAAILGRRVARRGGRLDIRVSHQSFYE